MSRIERIGNCTLYLGDCRDFIASVGADVIVTDPPYGVAGGLGSGLRKGGGRRLSRAAKSSYAAPFNDTADYIVNTVAPAIKSALAMTERAAITPGIRNLHLYPKPSHIGSFQYPGSTVMSCWGPVLWQPILFYGRDPHQGRLVPDSRSNCNDVDIETEHPCPKPIKQWTWLVQRASRVKETVFDPFMGSGTTGVACVKLDRSFVGVELHEPYFDVACRRIEAAQRQTDFFIQPTLVAKAVSLDMFARAAE